MKILLLVAVSIVAAAAPDESHACETDRTAIEMAGHTLCLLNSAMPSILRREDGSVDSLVWSHPERFPPEVQLPPGTFYLIVEKGKFNPPSLEQTESSHLPEMRETTDGLATHLFPSLQRFHPVQARLNGQPFVLECREAILDSRRMLGAKECQLISQVASGIRLEIHLSTVDWANGPAWPRLDWNWVETWPPYLADLESSLNDLLSIEQ